MDITKWCDVGSVKETFRCICSDVVPRGLHENIDESPIRNMNGSKEKRFCFGRWGRFSFTCVHKSYGLRCRAISFFTTFPGLLSQLPDSFKILHRYVGMPV